MTASPSNPGKDSKLLLAGVFDELAGAGTLDAAVRARNIPTIFATGYDASMIPAELADTFRLEKPVDMKALCRAIEVSCS